MEINVWGWLALLLTFIGGFVLGMFFGKWIND